MQDMVEQPGGGGAYLVVAGATEYQWILDRDIPSVDLASGAGRARIIAGTFDGHDGPAQTFTPINVWDLRLNRDAAVTLDVPVGHTAMLVVLSSCIVVNGAQDASEAEIRQAFEDFNSGRFGAIAHA